MRARFWPPLVFLFCILGLLEAGVALEILNPSLIPAPHSLLNAMADQPEDFLSAFAQTLKATLGGFLLASLLGFGAALFFSAIPILRRAVLPFAIFFQTVPIIAIAPLLVIYFGFGLQTVVVASAIVAIFPVLAGTLLGLESTDPGYLELMDVYGASTWKTLLMVRLPAAYPAIYAGLKIAAGLSVVGTVVGEFVAGGGLGALIDSARTQQRTDLVFASLALLSLIGLLLIGLVRLFNFLINRYRPYGLHLND